MSNILHEVFIKLPWKASVEAELIVDYLLNAGIPHDRIVENAERPYQRRTISVYCPTEAQAKKVSSVLGKINLPVPLEQKIVRKEDWIDKWKENFKPFIISKRFEVIPAWLKGKHQTKKGFTPIYIDTSVAFGTGLHETTRFMVQLIERCRGRFETFLDIGTGTGVLTVAGLHCGANDAMAIDISAPSVSIARDNLTLNGFVMGAKSPRLRVLPKDIKKFSKKDQFDFVAANLITHDLVANAETIVGLVKPGGYLACSGISIPNCCVFREKFDAMPLKCVKILKGEAWLAFLYKKL